MFEVKSCFSYMILFVLVKIFFFLKIVYLLIIKKNASLNFSEILVQCSLLSLRFFYNFIQNLNVSKTLTVPTIFCKKR